MNEFPSQSLPNRYIRSSNEPLQVSTDGFETFPLVLPDELAIANKLHEHVDILEEGNLGWRGYFQQVLILLQICLNFGNIVVGEFVEEVGWRHCLLEGRLMRLDLIHSKVIIYSIVGVGVAFEYLHEPLALLSLHLILCPPIKASKAIGL